MIRLLYVALPTVLLLSGCELFESKNQNANLQSLSVSSGVLTPAFSADVYSYSVDVDAATDSVTVTADAAHRKAQVSINGNSPMARSNSADVALETGSNTITVVVRAEKRKRQQTYTVEVERAVPTYSIGGAVSGLVGSLTLQNNGTDDLSISADGDFAFATPLDDGSTYNVTVAVQPEGQECTVTNGSGTLSGADVTDVDVDCVDLSFSVGGQITGLGDGNSIVLQNNGGDDLELTADGAFTFATELSDGADYEVTISSQPVDRDCTVSNGSGTIDAADVTSVIIDCGSIPIKVVAGTVSGIAGTMVLQLNESSDLLVTRNGIFNFSDQFTGGESYNVTVLTQPENQTCSVSNGSGTIGSGNVLDIVVECTGAGVATGSIFDWEWVTPLPQGNPILDLASDGNQVVAVGSSGLVLTSPDGVNWTTRDAGTPVDLGVVAAGNGVFVATEVGLGSILSSSDGATWVVRDLGFRSLRGVTWGGSQFVAVGYGYLSGSTLGALAATSPDGIEWSIHPVDVSSTFPLEDVAWNGSLYVAIRFLGNDMWTSPDGIEWTAIQVGDAMTSLLDIESDGSRFVATASGGVVFTSPDGATWTKEASQLPIGSPQDLHWDGSRFVAVGGGQQIAASQDGSAWTVETVGTGAGLLSAVVRHDGLTIVGSYLGAIHTSPDDTNWSTSFQQDSQQMYDLISDGSQFVAVGTGQTIRTSPDGITWTTRETGGAPSLFCVASGGGQFVAAGFGPSVLTSPDTVTWTPRLLPAGIEGLEKVAWGNNQFVGIGWQFGSILTSPDGETWTVQTSGFDGGEIFTDVAWSGTVWVATGYQIDNQSVGRGFVWTSPDGIDWTPQALPMLPDWTFFESIDSNGSILVAVGAQQIATSTDATTWSILQSNAGATRVQWSGGKFVVATYLSQILSSIDGVNWSATRAITSSQTAASNGSTTVILTPFGGWGIATRRPPPP